MRFSLPLFLLASVANCEVQEPRSQQASAPGDHKRLATRADRVKGGGRAEDDTAGAVVSTSTVVGLNAGETPTESPFPSPSPSVDLTPPTDSPAPSPSPSTSPTVPKSEVPSISKHPSVAPTESPEPSPFPSVTPSAAPTKSHSPTPAPSVSPAPTSSPSAAPVVSETAKPVAPVPSPTGAPVVPPTGAPIVPATDSPVVPLPAPTDAPVVSVTPAPVDGTVVGSSGEGTSETRLPVATTDLTPSSAPSGSTMPSLEPSRTINPTRTPSSSPTESSFKTATPSKSPVVVTSAPIAIKTPAPVEATPAPIAPKTPAPVEATSAPVVAATAAPVAVTASPSGSSLPSAEPSFNPTISTAAPTGDRSVVGNEGNDPFGTRTGSPVAPSTEGPSSVPSSRPSGSSLPSSLPSIVPSALPSSLPSSLPSLVPTALAVVSPVTASPITSAPVAPSVVVAVPAPVSIPGPSSPTTAAPVAPSLVVAVPAPVSIPGPSSQTTAEPVVPSAVTSVPRTSVPGTSAPVTSAPVNARPIEPPSAAPVSAAPVTPVPLTPAPVTSSPVAPVSIPAPVSSAPVTASPVTSSPVTLAPISATVTSAPVTSAPVTSTATTSAPITSAPITSAPVTSGPTPAPTSTHLDVGTSTTIEIPSRELMPIDETRLFQTSALDFINSNLPHGAKVVEATVVKVSQQTLLTNGGRKLRRGLQSAPELQIELDVKGSIARERSEDIHFGTLISNIFTTKEQAFKDQLAASATFFSSEFEYAEAVEQLGQIDGARSGAIAAEEEKKTKVWPIIIGALAGTVVVVALAMLFLRNRHTQEEYDPEPPVDLLSWSTTSPSSVEGKKIVVFDDSMNSMGSPSSLNSPVGSEGYSVEDERYNQRHLSPIAEDMQAKLEECEINTPKNEHTTSVATPGGTEFVQLDFDTFSGNSSSQKSKIHTGGILNDLDHMEGEWEGQLDSKVNSVAPTPRQNNLEKFKKGSSSSFNEDEDESSNYYNCASPQKSTLPSEVPRWRNRVQPPVGTSCIPIHWEDDP